MPSLKKKFSSVYKQFKSADEALNTLEKKLNASGLPYTPGRLPDYYQE